jgi:D-xylose 1-dehydrogenase (NADP+, D-xylono-1,5-lactone-forming)
LTAEESTAAIVEARIADTSARLLARSLTTTGARASPGSGITAIVADRRAVRLEARVRTVNWGILSTAKINRSWLAGARQVPDVEVVAVASRDATRAGDYAAEHGIPRAHGDYEALLADPDVHAVYVPLPNALHVEWARRALQAGKHVLCEKPLTPRPAEVLELFDLAAGQKLILSEAFMYRHHPQTVRLNQMVGDGAIGRLRMIRSAFSFRLRGDGDVRLSQSLDGGGLMDVGCYCVNAARMLAGEPERVHAEQTVGGDGVDVTFAAVMRFGDGVIAHFDAGLALAPRGELEVVGERGSLVLPDPWHCREPVIVWHRDDGVIQRIEIEPADPYALEVADVSSAIADSRKPLLGRADALGQARALEALLAAAAPAG